MATRLYFRATASDYGTGNNDAKVGGSASGWDNRALSTTAAAASTVASVTSTAGTTFLEFGTTPMVWYSAPLDADVTISGSIIWNLWMDESSMSANAAANGRLEVIDGATGAITLIDATARTTEITGIGARAVSNFAETPAAGVACKRGDRLRVRPLVGPAGTMAAGYAQIFGYDGSVAQTAESWLELTENLTFASEPAGTTVYPTDTAASLGTLTPTLLSSFTGADENPLSEGGNWTQMASAPMKRAGNAATGSLNGFPNASYWTPTSFGPDFEAYGTLTFPSGSDAGFLVRGSNPGSSVLAYRITAHPSLGTGIRLNVGGSLLSVSTTPWATGDKLGVACHGTAISVYRYPSGGSAWALIGSINDSTYSTTGLFGPYSGADTASIDDIYIGSGTGYFPVVRREAWTSRGAGVQTDVTNTVAGWTAPLQTSDTLAGTPLTEWYTKQLTAFTLGGAVRVNARMRGNDASSNTVGRVEIARVESDGTGATVWAAGSYGGTSSIGSSEAASSFLIAGDDLAISAGQRLRIRFYIDDYAALAMATGKTVTLYYAGTSGGASGDTYLKFGQTLTEYDPLNRVATASLTGGGVITYTRVAVGVLVTTTKFLKIDEGWAAPSTVWNPGTGHTRLSDSATVTWRVLTFGDSAASNSTSIGAAPVAGPTAGIEFAQTLSATVLFVTPPLAEAVTVMGNLTFNVYARELTDQNAAFNARLLCLHADGSVELIHKTARTVEMPTTGVVTTFSETVSLFDVEKGARLAIVPFIDDAAGGNMTSGAGVSLIVDNSSTAPSTIGITSVPGLTFMSTTPAGTTTYLTDTAVAGITPASLPLLTDFTGSDETPISDGGNWAALDSGVSGFRRSGNTASALSSATASGSYWTPNDVGPDVEMYATLSQSVALGPSMLMYWRLQGVGGASTWDGYGLQFLGASNPSCGRYLNGVRTLLTNTIISSPTWAAGDKIGISMVGSLISVYRWPSGGSAWALVSTCSDATYSAAGKIGFGFSTNAGAWDDLYAGSALGTFTGVPSVFREAWTTRGGATVTPTATPLVTGPTAGVLATRDGTTPMEWYTRPLAATTLVAPVLVNLRASASAATANAIIRTELAITDEDGANAVVWATNGGGHQSDATRRDILGAPNAVTYWLSFPDVTTPDGKRLRIRLYFDDAYRPYDGVNAGGAMASGTTGVVTYNGPTGGASGDSFLTFNQTLAEAAVSNDRTGTAALTGGGVATLARSSARTRLTTVATGGGVVTRTAKKGAQSVPAFALLEAVAAGSYLVVSGHAGVVAEAINTMVRVLGSSNSDGHYLIDGYTYDGGLNQTLLTTADVVPASGAGGYVIGAESPYSTGGGVITYSGVTAFPEVHSGTATFTGGGVVVASGLATRRSVVVATGGGVITQTSVKAGKSVAVATGGGVATYTGRKAAVRTQAMTGGGVGTYAALHTGHGSIGFGGTDPAGSGGGVITYAYSRTTLLVKSGTAVLSGGGVITYAYTSTLPEVHTGTATLTGGGVATSTSRKAAASISTATGGGVIVATSRKAGVAVAAVTGAGVITRTSIKAGQSIAALTAGGVAVILRSSTRAGIHALTGGGVAAPVGRKNAYWSTGLANGASVTSWPDLSGNGIAGPIVGSPPPVVSVAQLNDLPIVRFTTAQGRLRMDGVGVDKDFTVIYVARMRDSTPGRVLSSEDPVDFLIGWDGGYEDKAKA